LLTLDGLPALLSIAAFRDLPQLLSPGDLLVFNDTRVLPARLWGQKETGGRVEILVERLLRGMHGAGAHPRQQDARRPGSDHPVCRCPSSAAPGHECCHRP
jgi:S-adenosylmethionine:tRNA ribosyltransferase-isomerase